MQIKSKRCDFKLKTNYRLHPLERERRGIFPLTPCKYSLAMMHKKNQRSYLHFGDNGQENLANI